MKCKISSWRAYAPLIAAIALLVSPTANAQEKRLIKGEMATCEISMLAAGDRGKAADQKKYAPPLNQLGYFDMITNIRPHQQFMVQVAYPRAARSEKAWVIVLDGGLLDNGRKEQVVQLDAHRRLMFNFKAGASPGIYRVVVRKGSDSKVIQFWVGPETATVKK